MIDMTIVINSYAFGASSVSAPSAMYITDSGGSGTVIHLNP